MIVPNIVDISYGRWFVRDTLLNMIWEKKYIVLVQQK